jgi:hypothetical protein
MKIKTMKLCPNIKTNATPLRTPKQKEFTALKSIEFESLEYPEIEVKDLSFCGCKEREHDIEFFLNIRLTVSRNEFFELIKSLQDNEAFWREEDLPCTIKIDVHKKKKMDYWLKKKQ